MRVCGCGNRTSTSETLGSASRFELEWSSLSARCRISRHALAGTGRTGSQRTVPATVRSRASRNRGSRTPDTSAMQGDHPGHVCSGHWLRWNHVEASEHHGPQAVESAYRGFELRPEWRRLRIPRSMALRTDHRSRTARHGAPSGSRVGRYERVPSSVSLFRYNERNSSGLPRAQVAL